MDILVRYWPATLLFAALLEVAGDALVRRGVRPFRWYWFVIGGAVLALYGLFVNQLHWNFGKLLGVYVVFFAAVALLWSYLFPDPELIKDDENFYPRALCGLACIVAGGIIISWPEVKKLLGQAGD